MRNNPLVWWQNVRSALVGAALEGIIGNRADALFTLIWSLIQALMIVNQLSWYVAVIIFLINGVICIYLIRRSQIFRHAFLTSHKLLQLNDSLLRKLASLTPSQSTEKEMKRVVTDLLVDATAESEGRVHRAALLLPDASREYLYCWANCQMSQESIDNMKFYIGLDHDRFLRESSVAGEVFLTGELQVGHLRQIKGVWDSEDCPHYMKFPGRRPFPPYRSFMNIPLIGVDPNLPNSFRTICLGVLCLYSMNEHVFNDKACKDILCTFARHITAALLISRLYQNPPLLPTQGNSNP